MTDFRPFWQLWGKTDSEGSIHRLIYHLIDVGAVASQLWDQSLAKGFKTEISEYLGLSEENAGRIFSFWASIHDMGKATPAFQSQYKPAIHDLEACGFSFSSSPIKPVDFPHGVLSAYLLPDLLVSQTGLSVGFARKIARTLGGHHGSFPPAGKVNSLYATHEAISGRTNQNWEIARAELFTELVSVFNPPKLPVPRFSISIQNTLLAILSGFTSVADWIGSNSEFFPFEAEVIPSQIYVEKSILQAKEALSKLGWNTWHPEDKAGKFEETFGFPPYPLQRDVFEITADLKTPALVILEAPTGIGKTEAALTLSDQWAVLDRQNGLYVAMPTTATSNQMYGRVDRFLSRRYPGRQINNRLIHGQAIYSNDLAHLSQFADNLSGDYHPDYSWFMPSKKALLAPFGVGTVDQALLSVLMARHFFVRLYGLGRKTVIFDEIHAYDVYMSQLFQRLLEWLRQLGTSVILLSATLTEKTRRELVAAYSGISADNLVLPAANYPRLTCSSDVGVRAISLQKPPEKELSIEWINRDPVSIQEFLLTELEMGGCAAVLCNTVARAQEVFLQLSNSSLAEDTEITLFHARFPMAWRERIEKSVLADFGKGGRRPRAVVVATQVIEQSLDLDFDLMVTDLAPVDLLLQRAGRLHRHEITNRPEKLRKARLVITHPGGNWDVPEFDRDRFVYDEYILLRTYQVMKQKQKVLPISETTDLIETVYGNLALPGSLSAEMQKALDKSLLKMKKEFADEVREAQVRLIFPPQDEDFIYQPGLDLEEDDPTLHKSLQALTRLTEPSISLVCLHQTPGGLAYEPDGKGAPVDVARVFPEQSFEFLRRSITIQNHEVVAFFSGTTSEVHYPAPWKKNSALRHQRLAVFKDGYCEPEGAPFVLKLTRELGLEVIGRR